jgi:hypothetical protein
MVNSFDLLPSALLPVTLALILSNKPDMMGFRVVSVWWTAPFLYGDAELRKHDGDDIMMPNAASEIPAKAHIHSRYRKPAQNFFSSHSLFLTSLELGTTSDLQVEAKYVVRDDALILTSSLKNILGDTLLPDDFQDYLLNSFGPRLQVDQRGRADGNWHVNPSEAHVRIQS